MTRASDNSVIPANWQISERVVAFTTTRMGGVSDSTFDSLNLAEHVGDKAEDVAENRNRLRMLSGSHLSYQWLEQIHGVKVHRATSLISPPRADSLVTNKTDLACCVLTADCLPVFLAAKNGSEVAIAHAGWRGLAAGVVEATVAEMETPAHDLQAYLGPAIGPCHFEVGSDVAQAFSSGNGDSAFESCFKATANSGKYLANLAELAAIRLERLGIGVSRSELCTVCETESLYSYRRTPVTGRMANVIFIQS